MTRRIAMWSGPRNISTAMMRAWENRADTVVVDEPLYAAYLAETGIDHPMREEVLRSQPQDAGEVVRQLTEAPLPAGRRIFYQKHMTHHLLPSMDRGWLDRLDHAFLVRDPRRVVASYAEKRGAPTLADLGFPQQLEIFERVCARGPMPPVLRAEDVLRAPRLALERLCDALGVPFDAAMLRWPRGPRPSDGVWAAHWYDSVQRSTGFGPPTEAPGPLRPELEDLAERCRPHFGRLDAHRLVVP